MYKYIRDMDNLQATMKRLSIRRKMNNESQRNDAIPHSSYPEKKITQIQVQGYPENVAQLTKSVFDARMKYFPFTYRVPFLSFFLLKLNN